MQSPAKPIPHGTVSGYKYHRCRCLPCADASAAYSLRRRRRQGAGVWKSYVDPAPAVAHIEQLRAQGMTYTQISLASGLPYCTLTRVRRAPQKTPPGRISAQTEARVLAVTFDIEQVTEKAWVPALGAVRRMRALRAHGWPVHIIAARVGVDPRTLVAIQRQEVVYAETFLAMALAYDDLRDQDPVNHGIVPWLAERTRREALAAGWAVADAWTDIDADAQANPRVQRVVFRDRPKQRHQEDLLAETFHIAAGGAVREQIAERLDLDWDSIERAHNRGARPLPLALRS